MWYLAALPTTTAGNDVWRRRARWVEPRVATATATTPRDVVDRIAWCRGWWAVHRMRRWRTKASGPCACFECIDGLGGMRVCSPGPCESVRGLV